MTTHELRLTTQNSFTISSNEQHFPSIVMSGCRAEKPKSEMILAGRFAYTQNPPPKSRSNYSVKGGFHVFMNTDLCECVGFPALFPLQKERERSSGSDGGDRQ